MAATPYRPVSWNDQNLSQQKLQQMSSNDHWLYEHSPTIRYNYLDTVVRDSGMKIIAGKSRYAETGRDWIDVPVYFGNFFSAACRPVVTATVEGHNRLDVKISGHDGSEVDYRGFRAHVWLDLIPGWTAAPAPSGWLHWISIGF